MIALFCVEYKKVGAELWRLMRHFGYEYLRGMIEWLMGWPAGLKLNSQLDMFLGEMFLWMLYLWAKTWRTFFSLDFSLLDLNGLLFRVFALTFCAFGGFSSILGLFVDLFSISYFHLYICYLVATKLYQAHLHCLLSLIRLFRGQYP